MHVLVGPVGIWIAGGGWYELSATVEFIPMNNSNSQLIPKLPKTICYPSMFQHNEAILLCGGDNNLKTCLKLQGDKWTEYNFLKEERTNAAVVSTNTATFLFGGDKGGDTYEYLEKNASEWKRGETKIPGLFGFYYGCSIAISDDEIWLIGGHQYLGVSTRRILSFNVNNQKFTKLPTKLKHGRYGHKCAFIPETRNIIVTGGSSLFSDYDSTEIIDVETRKVTEGPPMNSKRIGHGIGVLNIDGQERVVVFGGFVYENPLTIFLNSVEAYNAQTQKWELTKIELSEAKAGFGFMTITSQP